MKKKILLLFAVASLMMVGCSDDCESDADGFETIVVDSCEYLYKDSFFGNRGYGFLAHKGNCRFCKEHRQKELKELVEQLKKNNYESSRNH